MAPTSAPTLKIPGQDPLAKPAGSQINSLLGSRSSAVGPKAPSAPKQSAGSVKTGKPAVGQTTGTKPVAPNNYGLNTTSNKPFNPFAQQTTGQFNQGVLNQAKLQWLPQQQAIQGGVSAENAAATQRNAQLKGIYNTYGQQATQAYNDAKGYLANLMSQQAAGDTAAQSTLSAALGSAGGPGRDLAGMMGATESGGSNVPYNLAALGTDNAGETELRNLAGSVIGQRAGTLADVGTERAQQTNAESLRHQAALEGFQGQRQALSQLIPGYIASARQTGLTNAQNAATTNLQNYIARQTLRDTQQGQTFNQNLQSKTLADTEKQTGVTNAQNWKRLSQNQETLDQNAKALANATTTTNNSNLEKVLGLQAKQGAAAQKVLQGYLAPLKTEYSSTSSTSQPTTIGGSAVTTRSTKLNQNAYTQRMNPQNLVAQIMSTGVSEQQALQMMLPVTQKYGYNPTLTMGQWAADQLYQMGQGPLTQDILAQRKNQVGKLAWGAIVNAFHGHTVTPSFLKAYGAARGATSSGPNAYGKAYNKAARSS